MNGTILNFIDMNTGKNYLLFILLLLSFLLPSLLIAQEFGGNPNYLQWKQLNNATSRVIFPNGMDSQANRIQHINTLLSNTTAYNIGGRQRKWNIVLLNQTTIPNAYVRMAPLLSELYMTPGQNNFNTGSLRWDDNLVIHENRHIQQLSNFNNGLTRVFSFLLGQEGQLLANGITVPDYFFEGDAVFQETLLSAQGRGRMPSFYNGMKSLWLANKNYSWMKLRSGSLVDYTPNHYELGYQLVAYGYEQYGDNFWRKVTQDATAFKGLFYAFNKAIEKHSGKSYPQFRKEALQYFRERSLPGTVVDAPTPQYLSPVSSNNVIDYTSPFYVGDDTLLVLKQSYKEIPAFYFISHGKEKKIRVRDRAIDDYFSYRNGKLVYAGYQSDPRWGNSNFSVIQLLDIYTGKQRQLGARTKYFSPDINAAGTEVLAVNVNEDGTNYLHRINAMDGLLQTELPNRENYFYTQTRYLDSNNAIAAVRRPDGQMALVKVSLVTGTTETVTPFSYNVVGYPFVKGDTIYFSGMHANADKLFAVSMRTRKLFLLTNNVNGIYQPAVSNSGHLAYTSFTAEGSRLASISLQQARWQEITGNDFSSTPGDYTVAALQKTGAGFLDSLVPVTQPVSPYKKSFRLFNFHSWRPEANDPEYSYRLYSDNILSTFSNSLTYTYNRSDRSSTLGFYEAFGGWLPVLSIGGEYSFNRNIDTAVGKGIQFNSAKLNTAITLPLQFVGRRTNKFLTLSAGYNLEQLLYRGIGKNVFNNRSLKYTSWLVQFSNISQQAKQHINPRWAQSISLSYRDGFSLVNTNKLVMNSAWYFPGLSANHSLVINASFQQRDTLFNLFSNNFSYSRGYEALSTRRMHKLGVNYHFPLWYPDLGIGNIIFLQRVRANTFYDHTVARARVNGILTNINNRSTGAEIYFDTRVWNALPVSFGFRVSHLLDRNLLNPGVKNYFEFILPIGLIPD